MPVVGFATGIEMLMDRVSPTATTVVPLVVSNPGAVTTTSTGPGASAPLENVPSGSVPSRACARPTNVTDASGTGFPPSALRTVPATVPVVGGARFSTTLVRTTGRAKAAMSSGNAAPNVTT